MGFLVLPQFTYSRGLSSHLGSHSLFIFSCFLSGFNILYLLFNLLMLAAIPSYTTSCVRIKHYSGWYAWKSRARGIKGCVHLFWVSLLLMILKLGKRVIDNLKKTLGGCRSKGHKGSLLSPSFPFPFFPGADAHQPKIWECVDIDKIEKPWLG